MNIVHAHTDLMEKSEMKFAPGSDGQKSGSIFVQFQPGLRIRISMGSALLEYLDPDPDDII